MATARRAVLVSFVLIASTTAQAAVFTVGTSGTYTTVKAACEAALAAGGDNEVRLRQGTFIETVSLFVPATAGRVDISGGWDQGFSVRTADPRLTVLDGDAAGTVFSLTMGGGTVSLENLTVTDGLHSLDGAGIHLSATGSSTMRVRGCRIVANNAAYDVGSPGQVGLSAYLQDTAALIVEGCVIADNTAAATGSASVSSVGVYAHAFDAASLVFTGNTVSNNKGSSASNQVTAGGLDLSIADDATLEFSDNTVTDNITDPAPGVGFLGAGAALSASGRARLTARRNVFSGNGTTTPSPGEQVTVSVSGEATALLESTVIARGAGEDTDGLDLWPAAAPSSLTAVNLTVADNSAHGVVVNGTGSLFLGNSIIAGNGEPTRLPASAAAAVNLVGADPLFLDRGAGDYRLEVGSPAIDAGDSALTAIGATDLSGDPRVAGERIDLGAYEASDGLARRVPSVAHLMGYGSTPWRTGFSIVNTSTEVRQVALHYRSTGTPLNRSVTLAGGEAGHWDDVLVELFGFDESAATGGSLHVTPSGSGVVATSRTYADPGAGTYGQLYPAVEPRQAISPAMTAAIPLVVSDSRFYTNIGMQVMSDVRCSATVTLRDPEGDVIATPFTLTAQAGRWVQQNDVLAGLGDYPAAYAEVDVNEGSGWFYAAVADRITRDPTTVPVMVQPPPLSVLLVPSVAHLKGFGGIPWKTSLAIVNTGDELAELTLVYRTGATELTEDVSLDSGEATVWEDVLVDLFGLADDVKSGGSLEIRATSPVVATSRTYADLGAGGTYGQWYPAVTSRDGASAGTIPLVRKDDLFYTNIGFINLGPSTVTVRIRLFDASGNDIGAALDRKVDPLAWRQINDVFLEAGAGEASTAYATVELVSAGGPIWAYAAVVDRTTRDPSTVSMVESP